MGAGVLRVGLAGFGAIGGFLARSLAAGETGLLLAGITGASRAKTRSRLDEMGLAPDLAMGLDMLFDHADVIVEAAPARAFDAIVWPALERGLRVVILSSGALLRSVDRLPDAVKGGGEVIVASGALAGLDAVKAMTLNGLSRCRLVTTKPPHALNPVDEGLKERVRQAHPGQPTRIFTGNAHEAAMAFPTNVNVAASLALAGPGAGNVEVEVWCDPQARRNRHDILLSSATGDLTVSVEASPLEGQPRTSQLAAASALVALREMADGIRIGT